MRNLTLEFIAAIALTLAAIIASAAGARAGDVMVMTAFARASATPVAKSGAAYVTLKNNGSEPDRLVAVVTPAASSAGLHVTKIDGDIIKMEAAGIVEIAPNATLEMKPGGLHVMLMGLRQPLREGSTIDITFTFKRAGEVAVKVPVGSAAAGEQAQGAASPGG